MTTTDNQTNKVAAAETGNADAAKKKPTKKEISKMKEAGRNKRKAASKERKAKKAAEKQEPKENPVTVTFDEEGFAHFHGRAYNMTEAKNKALEPYHKILLLRGLELQLDPTKEQMNLAAQANGCSRVVRNDYLEKRIAQYEQDRTTLSVSEYKKNGLKSLKEEKPYLKEVDKFALEAAVENVEEAYKNFFNGNASFPRFVSKFKPNGNRYTTKQTNNNIRFEEENGQVYLRLPKLELVKVIMPKGKTLDDLLLPGARITKATVIKDGSRYRVSLAIETVVDETTAIKVVERNRIVAMDMGIRKFCDFGIGEGDYHPVENPRWIKKHAKRLRRFQKALSRKQYDKETHTGSNNWKKAKEKVAKEMRKIANQRDDFQHKLSRKIADAYDVFICEDLNIKGMLRNRHLAKEIASAGWGKFLTYVKYKIEAKGGLFIKVDRWFPSSKLCSCGHKNTKLKSELYWTCPVCHKQHERDHNAIDNLANEGIRLITEMGIKILYAAETSKPVHMRAA